MCTLVVGNGVEPKLCPCEVLSHSTIFPPSHLLKRLVYLLGGAQNYFKGEYLKKNFNGPKIERSDPEKKYIFQKRIN